MRKLVLLLCCISVLLFAGCKAKKEVTEYNIADGEEVSLGGVPGTDDHLGTGLVAHFT